MRRVITILLSSAGVIAFLVVPSVDAKDKPNGERTLSVRICVGSQCAPVLTATNDQGAIVSLKTTADNPEKAVDRWPAPMKYAGTVNAPTLKISCPPTCSTTRVLQGKSVQFIVKNGPGTGYGSYDFATWEGVHCDEGQQSRTCTIHVGNNNPHVRAIFYNY